MAASYLERVRNPDVKGGCAMQTTKWYFMATCFAVLGLLLASCAQATAPAAKQTPATGQPPKTEASPDAKGAAPAATPKPADAPKYGGVFNS